MLNDCIILAGGAGTGLWPVSTASRPKQFLSLPPDIPAGAGSGRGRGPGRSLFGAALKRALALLRDSGDGHVIITAGKNHVNFIIEECAGLENSDKKRLVLIPEPLPRDTAPAIACALVYLDWITAGRERNILSLSSDHIIRPFGVFRTDVNAAAAMAQADKLAVLGAGPDKREPNRLYIKTARALGVPREENTRGRRRYEPEVFSIASFREKPGPRAKNFYINSGMFAFSSKFLLAEFRRSSPGTIAPFSRLWAPNKLSHHTRKGVKVLEAWNGLEAAYRRSRSVSFEEAIAEKCETAVMVKAGFSFTDIGTWDDYAPLVKRRPAALYGSGSSCFVDSDIPVALCGVEGLIVAARSGKDGGPRVILISRKGESHRVKEIVEGMRKKGASL